MAQAPVFRAVGTVAVTGGGASMSPGLPAGTVAGDLLLLIAGHEPLATSLTCSGWSLIAEQDALVAGWGHLSVFLRRATGSGDAPTTSAPSQAAVSAVLGYQAGTFDWIEPVVAIASQRDTTVDSSRTFAGLHIPVSDCAIVLASDSARDTAEGTDGWASWATTGGETVTQRVDHHTNAGNGHGIGVATFTRAVVGTMGTSSASTAGAGTMPDNNYTLCIQPPRPRPVAYAFS